MFRPLMIAVLLATSAPALARTGPEIAYSTGSEVYLVNPEGTGKVRIYRGKGNAFISSVSLRHDGGAVAFVENWVLKFMNYAANGAQMGTVFAVPGCYRQADVQYHPGGNSVIYQELCGATRLVKQIAIPTAANPNPAPSLLFENADLIDLGGWDGSGQSFVYSIANATGWELRRHFLSGEDVLVVSKSAPGSQLRYPGLSHDGTKTLASDWNDSTAGPAGTGYSSIYDTASGAVVPPANLIAGQRADYAPDDVRILYTAKDGRQRALRYRDSTGLARQIVSGTALTDADWGD